MGEVSHVQRTGSLPRKERSRCSSDPDILLTGLHCKDGVSFLNKPIAIDIQRSEEKMHIKLSVITRYEEWVAKLAELRCTTNKQQQQTNSTRDKLHQLNL